MKVCALVGASEFNEEHFRERDEAGFFDYVIAVDGGLTALEALGRKPDVAMGDFDSLGYVPRGMRVVRYPVEKDKSDMELALDRVRRLHYDEAYIYGALGGRLDHTLANLQLGAKFSERGVYVRMIGAHELLSFITGPDVLELPAAETGTVSVFSLSDEATGVFERGLRYGLDDAVLTNRTSLGLSNEMKGEGALIGVESGTLVVCMPFES